MSTGSNIPHAARSDVGRRRDHNEDAVHVAPPLLVVADGVGGSAKGEVASRLAIDTFVAEWAAIASARDSSQAVRAMESAVLAANSAVHESQLRDESRRGMATTVTAAVVRDGGEVIVGHVGDSRLYVLSATGARQVTQDHSVVAELVRGGRISAQDAATHPQRNVITRALGPERDVSVDAFVEHAGPGDWLLACSDGLTEHVTDDELVRIVLDCGHDADAAARRLVELANERGGTDNITVALVQPVPSDVSGELSIEALRAADVAATGALPATTPAHVDAPAEDSGPLPALAATPARGGDHGDHDDHDEASSELPALQPIPHEEDWDEPRRQGRGRFVGLVALLVLVGVLVLAGLWSQSYFLVAREDGYVGIDRGFPFAGMSTEHATSDVPVDELDAADRERLVDSHRILGREDAERVLDELPRRLEPAEAGGA